MRFVWRVLLVLVVFLTVGLLVDRAVIAHERKSNTPDSQIRLSAAMAGLFAGGASASLLTLALAFKRTA